MLTFDEETHIYRWNGMVIPSVTRILGMLTDLKHIPADVLRYAADRGKAVHYGTELYDEDNLDWASVDDELVPYIEAWADFRATTGFTPTLIEHPVFHPALFYAGKLDRVGTMDGEIVLLDIKTSKTMYPTVGPQLAAYATALATEKSAPNVTRRAAVQLKDDGTWALHEYEDKHDWPVFLAAKTLLGWANKHRQGISYEYND